MTFRNEKKLFSELIMKNEKLNIICVLLFLHIKLLTEAVTQGCSIKKVFLKI